MEKLLRKLQRDFPNISFVSGKQLHWSPNSSSISYNKSGDVSVVWGLLHEVGHAILEHKNYTTDVELLQKETAAWAKARDLAQTYNISLDEDHIQDCLDTYRDWLHCRSTCPTCQSHGIEPRTGLYKCLNC